MSLLGKILAGLNILAAAGFAYLALLDFQKRQTWAHAVFARDQAIRGVAAQEQYTDPSLPRERYLEQEPLDPKSKSLAEVFQGGAGQPVNTQVKEVQSLKDGPGSFVAKMDAAAKEAAAGAKGKEEAVLRTLFTQVAANGRQLAAYNQLLAQARAGNRLGELVEEFARRWMLGQALLPLEEVRPGGHRDQVAAQIGDLNQRYDNLTKLLTARFDDVLRPEPEGLALKGKNRPAGIPITLLTERSPQQLLYQRSPADQKVTVRLVDAQTGADAGGDLNPVTVRLFNVKGQPRITLNRDGTAYGAKDEAFKEPHQVLAGEVSITRGGKPVPYFFVEREPLERREAIAFLLFTLSKVTTPAGTPLGAPPEARAEVVTGREAFNVAMARQTVILTQVAERRRREIQYDRESFIGPYNQEVKERLPYLIAAVARSKAVLEDWETQKRRHDEQLTARRGQLEKAERDLQEGLRQARAALTELEAWQKRLFQVERAGAGVAEENQRLEKKIRELEKGR